MAAYLKTEETKALNDEEIIMDMFQMLVFGTYGLITQVTMPVHCQPDSSLHKLLQRSAHAQALVYTNVYVTWLYVMWPQPSTHLITSTYC